jgi:hypothetical protein
VEQNILTILVFTGVHFAQSLVICVECSGSFVCHFILLLLTIALSVLRFTASDFPFEHYKRGHSRSNAKNISESVLCLSGMNNESQ